MKFEETYLPPSRAEMAARVASLQSAMDHNGLEAYVSVATANILWLTNFANFVHERPFILVVPRSGAPKFVVPFLELDHVNHRVVGDVEFVPYREFPAPCGQRWQDRFADILPVQGGIGIEEMLPQALVGEIGARARPLDLIDTLRETKSDYEISRIAYGCRLMSEAHAELLRAARPGLSQSEINRSIGRDIHAKMVADNPALNPFATSIMTLIQNPSVSHDPHNFTDLDIHMVDGGPHVTVFNSVLNGYGAEIERTFFLGAVPDDAKRPFEAMMEARRIVFEKTRAGAILEDIDREVNAFFNANGYEEARRHRAGHGMGVTAHEGPFIAEGDRREVRPGMVFTIEPGIYLRGVGGFRHSDTVLVTEDSLECLTFGPDQLEALILQECDTMASSTCDLSTAAACATAIRRMTGCDDVTLLAFRPEADEADRVYSTVPEIFPQFGAKPIPKGKWTTLIIREQRPVLFAGASAIIATFPDHGVILGNGYRAVFNVPVTVAQRCMGSVNCLFFDENPVLDNDEATRRIGELVDLADIFGA